MIPQNLYRPISLGEHEKAKNQHLEAFYLNYHPKLKEDQVEEKDETELAPAALENLKKTLCSPELLETYPELLLDLDKALSGSGSYPSKGLVLRCFKTLLLINALCKEEKDETELAPAALDNLKNTLCPPKLLETYPELLSDLDKALGSSKSYPSKSLVLRCFKTLLLINALCKEVREEQEQEQIKRNKAIEEKRESWKNLSEEDRKVLEEKEAQSEADLLKKEGEYANLKVSLGRMLSAAVGLGVEDSKMTLDEYLSYIQSFYFLCTTKEASHQLLEGFKINHLLPELTRLGFGVCEPGKLSTLNELLVMGRRDTNWISTNLHGYRHHAMRQLGIRFIKLYRKPAEDEARLEALDQGKSVAEAEVEAKAAGMRVLTEGYEVHVPTLIMELADADGYGMGYVKKIDVYLEGTYLAHAITNFYKRNAPAYFMQYEKTLFSLLSGELKVKIKQALKEQGIDLESWDGKDLVLSSKAHPTGGIINALHKILPLPEEIARELFKPLDQKEEEEEKDEVELSYRIKKKEMFFNLIGRQLKPRLQEAFPPSNEVPQALWDEYLKQLKLRTVEAFKTDLGIQLDDWEDQGLTFDARKVPFDSIKKTLSKVIVSLSNLPDFPPGVSYKPLPDYVLKEPLQKPEPQKNYQLKKKPEFLAVLRGILYRKQEEVKRVAAEVKEEANLEQIADDLRMQKAKDNSQKKLRKLETFLVEKGIDIELWDSEVLSFTSKDDSIIKEIMSALELPEASSHLFEEPKEEFYSLKADFFACLEEQLAQHLVNEGYYAPFEKERRPLRKQLETHKHGLLQDPQFLLKALAKDPTIYCLLPDEIKKNHQFTKDFVNLLNAVFEKMFQEEELDEERLELLIAALKEVLALDPSYLSPESLPCLSNPKARLLKEKLIASNPLLIFRMPQPQDEALVAQDEALVAQDEALVAQAQRLNPLIGNIEACRLEYVKHMKTLREFLKQAPSFCETFLQMSVDETEKDYLSFFYTLEQIKAVHQLTNTNNRLSTKQVIAFAQTLTPSMLLQIMKYRERQGWEPLPGCHRKALTQFNQALVPFAKSCHAHTFEDLLDYVKTDKAYMKDQVQIFLSKHPKSSQTREALELLLHSPDWVSAYLQFQHNASFSPFQDIRQFAMQLQYSLTQLALLVNSIFNMAFAVAMMLLSLALEILLIVLVESLLITFIVAYTNLFLWSTFLLCAGVWMNGLLHYNTYSYAVEAVFPALSLTLLFMIAVMALPFTIVPLELQALIVACSPIIICFLVSALDLIRNDPAILRGAPLWNYCYKIALSLPTLLSIAYAGGFLLTGTSIVAGLLTCLFLSKQFSGLENTLLKMCRLGHSMLIAAASIPLFIADQLINLLQWSINLYFENQVKYSLANELISPLLSRSYETYFLRMHRLPETLTVACENRIAELCSMKGDLAAQEKGDLLDKIWKQIQADRKPAQADDQPLPTLESLLHKLYPIEEGLEDGKKASFLQIAASRRTNTQEFELEPENNKPVGYLDRGLRFFRGSTATSNRIQAAINRALPEDQAEPAGIKAIA